MRTHLVGSLVLLSLVLALRAWAGLDEGIAAYPRGDYATAFREFLSSAQQGDVWAMAMVGGMYEEGKGVPQDYAQSFTWYRRAAAQGQALAQYNLGGIYYKGQGVPQDYAQAMQWYRRAAAQGYASAQYNLGVMYHNGEGVPQNYQQAYFWYNLAAAQKASNPTDHEKAVRNRDRMAARLTRAQLAQAQAQARAWQPHQEHPQAPVEPAARTAAPPHMAQPTQTQQVPSTPAPVPKHCPYPFIDISKLLPFLLSPGGLSAGDFAGLEPELIVQVMQAQNAEEELRRKSVEAVINNAREIQRLRAQFCVGTVD